MRTQRIITPDERELIALVPFTGAGVLDTPNLLEIAAWSAALRIAILKDCTIRDGDICNKNVIVAGISQRLRRYGCDRGSNGCKPCQRSSICILSTIERDSGEATPCHR